MSRRLSGPRKSVTVKSVPALSSAEQVPANAIVAGRWSRSTGDRNRLADIAQIGGPFADVFQSIERCLVASKLGEEDGRAFNSLHVLVYIL